MNAGTFSKGLSLTPAEIVAVCQQTVGNHKRAAEPLSSLMSCSGHFPFCVTQEKHLASSPKGSGITSVGQVDGNKCYRDNQSEV